VDVLLSAQYVLREEHLMVIARSTLGTAQLLCAPTLAEFHALVSETRHPPCELS